MLMFTKKKKVGKWEAAKKGRVNNLELSFFMELRFCRPTSHVAEVAVAAAVQLG